MATDLRGHTVPAVSEGIDFNAINKLSASINATKTVANMVEADQYLAALTAASLPTTAAMVFNTADQKYYGRIGNKWAEFKTSITDTGWVTTGLTITPATGWTIAEYALKVTSGHVFGYIRVTRTGATITPGPDGNFPDVPMVTLPADLRYSGPQSVQTTISWSGVRTAFGRIDTSGTYSVTHGIANQPVENGSTWQLPIDYPLG